MPPGGALSQADKDILRGWIASGAAAPSIPPTTLPAATNPPTSATGTLEEQAVTILQNHCYTCHGSTTSGGLSNINNPASLISGGWITPGTPSTSRVYDAISKGRMPPNGMLASSDISIISDWITQGAKAPSNQPPPPATIPLTATFSGINANIIQPKCVSCHSATLGRGGIRLYSYNLVMKYVKPGTANSSKLFSITNKGEMPPKPNTLLNAQELKAISDWINSGAPNN